MAASSSTRPSTITYTYHDPSRTFDGTPYEAAGLAIDQASAVAKLFQRALRDTAIQVRNAHLQRDLDLGDAPNAEAWETSAQKRLLDSFSSQTSEIQARMKLLRRAAAYDPKNPPKEL
jgi:hypothetical protein